MLRSLDPTQDLKITILELKKDLAKTRNDNQLLKVKIRKLQNECSKRDRQIETLLDPRKSSHVKKVISDRGATMIINLNEENQRLEKVLLEKDSLIKRLQGDLQIKKAYTCKLTDKRKQAPPQSKCGLTIPYYNNEQLCVRKENTTQSENNYKSVKSISMNNINNATEKHSGQTKVSKSPRSLLTRRSLSADRRQFEKIYTDLQSSFVNSDTKAQYEGLSRDHLLSIIEGLKNNQQKYSPRFRKGGSPESDLERNELLCDTPHQEIQQLQNYFMDMLAEVDQLKVTISTLKNEQSKTTNILKEKDNSITQLAKEIKSLKRPKSEVKNSTRLRRQSSHLSHLGLNRRQTRNLDNVQSQTAVTILNEHKEGKNEDTNNPLIYKEVGLTDEKVNLKVIHTRTMSIQTLDEPTTDRFCEQIPNNENLLNVPDSYSENEEEKRRKKFSDLLQEIQHITTGNFSRYVEAEEPETEYI